MRDMFDGEIVDRWNKGASLFPLNHLYFTLRCRTL